MIRLIRLCPRFMAALRAGERLRRLERGRGKAARILLSALSGPARSRFSVPVLMELLKAGWTEGRAADAELLKSFGRLACGDARGPALAILHEFGGLRIGRNNRVIEFGAISPGLLLHRERLNAMTGLTLTPVGETNIFENDGLGVHVDEGGRVFVDGATGFERPRNYRIDYVARSIERAL